MVKHNNKIQEINLSMCKSIKSNDVKKILKVKKLDRAYFILRMNRVKHITKKAAKLLSKSHFNEIELKGLKSVENKTLRNLAKTYAALDIGLKSVNENQANILLINKAALVLSSIKSISKNVSEILSEYKGNILELPGLEKVDNDSLSELNKFKGEFLLVGNFIERAKY